MRREFPAWSLLLLASPALLLPGCERDLDGDARDKDKEAGAAGNVERAVEGGLPILKLREDQERNLGIRIDAVEARDIPRDLDLTGSVEPPPGAGAEIRSPVAGHLLPGPSWPIPGKAVEAGEELSRLRPVLPPLDRIQAQSLLLDLDSKAIDLEKDRALAKSSLEISEAQLQRATELLAATAGSRKTLEEATLKREKDAADLEAAQLKRGALEEKRRRILGTLEAGKEGAAPGAGPGAAEDLPPIPLRSPIQGLITAVRASPGEFAEAGKVLFEVAGLGTVWIRVPVFEGDLERIDPASPIQARIAGAPGAPLLSARPAAHPPVVDPAGRTADLYYEAPNPNGLLRKGQSLAVRMTLKGSRAALTASASALVFDPEGVAWIYVSLGEHRFARRRVEPGTWAGDRVEIRRGLKAGEKVVAAGAPELFGAEFGTEKEED